jgi:thiamine biosynthesis lipoprotein
MNATAPQTNATAPQTTASQTGARWQALGSDAVLKLAQPGPLAEARTRVEAELQAINRACSRFRADSDLCRLNDESGRSVVVDPLLLEAVEVALRAAELTDGDVDPSVGGVLELAGYDRDWALLGDGAHLHAGRETSARLPVQRRIHARVRPGWRAVEVDRDRCTLRTPPGVKLDLGATAKAWAADRAANAAFEVTGAGVLVALGGDIATAGPCPRDGWRVRVTDDHRGGPDAPGQTIAIRGGGLATSSTTVRRWIKGGAEMHHIIDPATGAPSQGMWRTVSVAAATCTEANIASTAAILRSRRAPRWLAQLELPSRLVAHDGAVLHVGGWPAQVGLGSRAQGPP